MQLSSRHPIFHPTYTPRLNGFSITIQAMQRGHCRILSPASLMPMTHTHMMHVCHPLSQVTHPHSTPVQPTGVTASLLANDWTIACGPQSPSGPDHATSVEPGALLKSPGINSSQVSPSRTGHETQVYPSLSFNRQIINNQTKYNNNQSPSMHTFPTMRIFLCPPTMPSLVKASD